MLGDQGPKMRRHERALRRAQLRALTPGGSAVKRQAAKGWRGYTPYYPEPGEVA